MVTLGIGICGNWVKFVAPLETIILLLAICFSTGLALQCHLPSDGRILHDQAHAPALRGQPDGRAHPQGHHAVLRLRAGKTEGN